MKKRWLYAVLAVMVLVMSAGCDKVDTQSNREFLQIESIPLEFGNLVAVTTMTEYPGWSQLWFVQSDGSIKMVRYHFVRNVIMADVKLLKRS